MHAMARTSPNSDINLIHLFPASIAVHTEPRIPRREYPTHGPVDGYERTYGIHPLHHQTQERTNRAASAAAPYLSVAGHGLPVGKTSAKPASRSKTVSPATTLKRTAAQPPEASAKEAAAAPEVDGPLKPLSVPLAKDLLLRRLPNFTDVRPQPAEKVIPVAELELTEVDPSMPVHSLHRFLSSHGAMSRSSSCTTPAPGTPAGSIVTDAFHPHHQPHHHGFSASSARREMELLHALHLERAEMNRQKDEAVIGKSGQALYGWQAPPACIVASDRQFVWQLPSNAPTTEDEANSVGEPAPAHPDMNIATMGGPFESATTDYQTMMGRARVMEEPAPATPPPLPSIDASLGTRAVLLHNPLRVVTCEHLEEDTLAVRRRQLKAQEGSGGLPPSSVAGGIPPGWGAYVRTEPNWPPRGKLRHPLAGSQGSPDGHSLSSCTGGFPTLLRVGPLTDLSPIVDKENCVELVFWYPNKATTEPPEEKASARSRTGLLGMLGDSLQQLDATISLKRSPSPQQTGERPRATVGGSAPSASESRSTQLGTDGAEDLPHVDLHGSERQSLRRSSASTHRRSDVEEKEEGGLRRPQREATLNPTDIRAQPATSLWPDAEGSSQSSEVPSAPPVVEAPATPTHRGASRIAGSDDELCVVLRAVLAQKSKVERFGREEVVHVLPPLPREEEFLTNERQKDRSLERLAVKESGAVFRLLQDSTAKTAAAKRKQQQMHRSRRIAAKGPVTVNEDGAPSAEDYGDLIVAFLLSGGTSQLSGLVLDAMELESLRYKVFTLEGYSSADPFGINKKKADDASVADGNFSSPRRRSSASRSPDGSQPSVGSNDSKLQSLSLTTREEHRAREWKEAKQRRRRYMQHFPMYRASSIAETTLQDYHHRERSAVHAIRRSPPAPLESTATNPEHERGRSTTNVAELEEELRRFRPLNLNGFYGELRQAVQFALDVQVRQAKEKVMQAYHM